MLTLDSIRKHFGRTCIIEHASLHVASGNILCLSGASGIGKTTLLEIMAGTLQPDGGRIIRGTEAAMAFQDDVLLGWLGALANVEYALSALSKNERFRRASLWLQRFELPHNRFPAEMSGGMRRRLCLARTFAVHRGIIILDEPYAFLDDVWQQRVTGFIAQARDAGAAIVLASHQLLPLCGLEAKIVEITTSPIVLKDTNHE